MLAFLQRWKQGTRILKREVYALYFAYRDPRTPWYGKAFAALVAAYAFSPIDLIPDPIPILGMLDDLILVPLGVVIAIRLVPVSVMADARDKAEVLIQTGKPVSRAGAALIIIIWIGLAALGLWWVTRLFQAT